MSKKIKEEELEAIKKIYSEVENIENTLGKLEIDKSKLISKYFEYEKELSILMKDLENKYGNVKVNLNTGEIVES